MTALLQYKILIWEVHVLHHRAKRTQVFLSSCNFLESSIDSNQIFELTSWVNLILYQLSFEVSLIQHRPILEFPENYLGIFLTEFFQIFSWKVMLGIWLLSSSHRWKKRGSTTWKQALFHSLSLDQKSRSGLFWELTSTIICHIVKSSESPFTRSLFAETFSTIAFFDDIFFALSVHRGWLCIERVM